MSNQDSQGRERVQGSELQQRQQRQRLATARQYSRYAASTSQQRPSGMQRPGDRPFYDSETNTLYYASPQSGPLLPGQQGILSARYSPTATREPVPQAPQQSSNPAASTSVRALKNLLEVAEGFDEDCRSDAEGLSQKCCDDHHARIQYVLKSTRFQAWLSTAAAFNLMIKDFTGDDCEEECGCDSDDNFSLLSSYASVLSMVMKAYYQKTITLTFFCDSGEHEGEEYFNNINVALLRSFCYQLLDHEDIDPEVLRHCSLTLRDKHEVARGDLDQLRTLFEDLATSFSRSGHTIVCFIDGVQSLEGELDEEDDDVKEFLKTCESFKRLSAMAHQSRSCKFKILLTVAGHFGADLGRRLRGELTTSSIDVPDSAEMPRREPIYLEDRRLTFQALHDLLYKPR